MIKSMIFCLGAFIGFVIGALTIDKDCVDCDVDQINREVIRCIDLVDRSNASLERCELLLREGLGLNGFK